MRVCVRETEREREREMGGGREKEKECVCVRVSVGVVDTSARDLWKVFSTRFSSKFLD